MTCSRCRRPDDNLDEGGLCWVCQSDADEATLPPCSHGVPEGADCQDCQREAAEDAAAWIAACRANN
mgnify:CR=1 FL=1